ncbi:MAG: hypothetical protein VX069_02240 [Cyanobacteriota bacterium]|nr:hypothetical protein [Cyanobacteriota bacterium]
MPTQRHRSLQDRSQTTGMGPVTDQVPQSRVCSDWLCPGRSVRGTFVLALSVLIVALGLVA